jgi:hypothetical protein
MNEQKENTTQLPELLQPLELSGEKFTKRVSELNSASREKLPQEIKAAISHARLIGEGVGKSLLGLAVDLGEGAGSFLYSWGLSEVLPVTEVLADYGTAKVAEALTNRPLRKGSKFWGYTLSFVPFVGDFASPTFFDGMVDIYQGTQKLINNQSRLVQQSHITNS